MICHKQQSMVTAMRAALLVSLFACGPLFGSCRGADAEGLAMNCRRQMLLMGDALAAYRQDHGGSFPLQLGDLIPGYLTDPGVLKCPAALEKGKAGVATLNFIDPCSKDGRVIGYTWEMCQDDPDFWEGQGYNVKFAKFKELQRRSLIGEWVPVVRCGHHGADHHLNLTASGKLYESGEYWECNFADTLPGPRLAPELVEQANLPMSALVRPRSTGATSAMLDLRPWYNARFEDPWIMVEHWEEQTDFARYLTNGFIVSQGIAFDAAGIVQLNGKITAQGGWAGFTRLKYPTAVRSITVNKPFRVMHVLGAVLFEDPVETIVARIELHRDGSHPKSVWVWRYGLDTLTYRFVPSAAEPRLSSTAVAWQGGFLNPQDRGQKPRLFHLRFVNPEPEAIVSRADFFTGDGHSAPFISSITLE